MRDEINQIKNIRERAITVTQFKTGARSSEIGNVELSDINLSHPEVREHYDMIGENKYVAERPNSIYIPPGRGKNKRNRYTVIPLDEETRKCIVDWLLIRPDNGRDALFFTDKGNSLAHNDIRHIWVQNWWPEYEYEEEHENRSVSPHYARHFFSNWWRVKKGIDEELVKYMRGDMTGDETDSQAAIHRYLHSHYEDVEDIYREQIFQFYLSSV